MATDFEVRHAAQVYPSKAEAARKLGMPPSTFKGRLAAIERGLVHGPSEGTDDYVEVPVIHRDYSHLPYLCVFPIGDVHKGSPAHDTAVWRAWLDKVNEFENSSIILTGDLFNTALKTSVSESYDECLTLRGAREELEWELEPLKSKIDLAIPGNHEARFYRAVGDCPVAVVADKLGVPYAQEVAFVVYHVGEQRYTFLVRHGSGGGMIGARAGRLLRQAEAFDADVYISGHTHAMQAFPSEQFKIDPKTDKPSRHRRYFIASGSFLRYEPYAAVQAYPPTMLGAPLVFLGGADYRVHVTI